MENLFQLQRFANNNHSAPYGFLSRDDKDQIDILLNTQRDIRVDLSKKTVVDINTPGDFTLGIQNTLPVDSGGTGVGNLNNITVGGAARDANGNVLTTTYAPLASPALTGSPTATTAAEGDSSTRIATTAFVTRAIKTLIGTAPAILDTLGEISAAINADANVYQTLNEAKQPRHAALTSISGLSTSANQMIYTTASNTYTTTSLTAYARTLLDDADAATARNTLDVPSKTGSGASGTWSISISGTAARATADANGATIASTYLKLSGGTMTGALTFANNIFNTVGDDVQFGDFNVAGTLGIRGANGTTGLALLKQGSTTDYALLSYNGANLISNKTITANLAGNANTATTATTAGNVTGTVAIANGGTGATTVAVARQNLFGSAMNTAALAKYVITINDSWVSGGYTTLQQLRNFMGLGDTTSYLPVANGGTGTNNLNNVTVGKANSLASAQSLKVSLNSSAAQSFNGSGAATVIGVGGTLPIANGGTGATTAAAALTALGAAAASHGNHVPATQTANNKKFLRNDNTWQEVTPANIGAAAASHTHSYAATSHSHGAGDINSGTLSIARGGTGASTAAAARNSLGAAASDHTHSNYAASSHTHSEYAKLSGAAFTGNVSLTSNTYYNGTKLSELGGNVDLSGSVTICSAASSNAVIGGGASNKVSIGTGSSSSITVGSSSSSLKAQGKNIVIGDSNTDSIVIGHSCKKQIGLGVSMPSGSALFVGYSCDEVTMGEKCSKVTIGGFANNGNQTLIAGYGNKVLKIGERSGECVVGLHSTLASFGVDCPEIVIGNRNIYVNAETSKITIGSSATDSIFLQGKVYLNGTLLS